MDEFVEREVRVERRIFVKGALRGKVKGSPNPELYHSEFESSYDLEFLDCEVVIDENDVSCEVNGETPYPEYGEIDVFRTTLPNPVKCSYVGNDGSVRYFRINVSEPKLKSIGLFNQVYDANSVFSSIEAQFCGFLTTFVNETVSVPVITTPISVSPSQDGTNPSRIPIPTVPNPVNAPKFDWNRYGERGNSFGWSELSNGCSVLIAALFGIYIGFALLLGLLIVVWNLFIAILASVGHLLIFALLMLALLTFARFVSSSRRWIILVFLVVAVIAFSLQ